MQTSSSLTFVLSGGGAHGALQVGALRALWERGFQPERLVGTSIGAVNSAFVALHGWSLETIQALTDSWLEVSHENPLPGNYLWLSMRTVFGTPDGGIMRRLKELFASYGVTETATFAETKIPLGLVAADLNSGEPVIFGQNASDLLLDGVLASTALPPWILPIEKDNLTLVDGGFASNLPIEPALKLGATRIIALDLADTMGIQSTEKKSKPFFSKAIFSVIARQRSLELALAEACRVPVQVLSLRSRDDITLWDFSRSAQLIEEGYEIACKALSQPC